MRRSVIVLWLLLLASALFAQDIDMSGSWEVYRLTSLARYTLRDYQAGQATIQPDEMNLNADGTATATIPNLSMQKWLMEEGFLILETSTGNVLYYPRQLSEDVLFLVQLDVLKLNEDIISIKTGSFGHMVLVKK